MCKAGFDKKGNIKLGGKMYTFSKLYGNQEHYIKNLGMFVCGSCGSFCNGCKEKCYVKASYRYGSVIYKHAVNTLAMRNDMTGLFSNLDMTIKRAKNKPEQVRINQSGEIESRKEFSYWCDLAGNYPAIKFYLYTKAFKYVVPEILERWNAGTLPENMTINISV